MVTTELEATPVITPDESRSISTGARRVVLVWLGLWVTTLLGAALAVLWPGLAPAGRPHPALRATVGAIAAILVANARVLSVPFILTAFRFQGSPRLRLVGDVLVAAVLARSAITIGLALGHIGARLLPYIPQLPVEYAAAAAAAGAWVRARDRHPAWRTIARWALLALALLTAGACIEVLATPHAR